MFRTVTLHIIRSLFTVHLALVYVTLFVDSFRAVAYAPARKLSTNRMTYTSAKCTVNKLLMMGRGTARNI